MNSDRDTLREIDERLTRDYGGPFSQAATCLPIDVVRLWQQARESLGNQSETS